MVVVTKESLQLEAENFLSIADLATILRKSPAALGAMRSRGSGPRFVKIGRTILYRPADVAAFIENSSTDRAVARW
jgi:hypothetical protein